MADMAGTTIFVVEADPDDSSIFEEAEFGSGVLLIPTDGAAEGSELNCSDGGGDGSNDGDELG